MLSWAEGTVVEACFNGVASGEFRRHWYCVIKISVLGVLHEGDRLFCSAAPFVSWCAVLWPHFNRNVSCLLLSKGDILLSTSFFFHIWNLSILGVGFEGFNRGLLEASVLRGEVLRPCRAPPPGCFFLSCVSSTGWPSTGVAWRASDCFLHCVGFKISADLEAAASPPLPHLFGVLFLYARHLTSPIAYILISYI